MNAFIHHVSKLRAGRNAALACHGLAGFALILLAQHSSAQNVEFTQTSSPAGIVNQTTFPQNGAAVATVSAPLTSGTNRFTHWTINGVRMNNASGSGTNPAAFTITVPTSAIANYLPVSQDSDVDTLPDWFEVRHFAGLTQGPDGDFDADGFSNGLELSLGQHPGVFDERQPGGNSRRRIASTLNVVPGVADPSFIYGGTSRRRAPSLTVVLDSGFVRLVETSDPDGIVTNSRVVTTGTTVNLSIAPALFSGFRFTGWLVGGQRLDIPPQNQPTLITVTQDTLAVARYISDTMDSDEDGIMDWIEWYHFNSLENSAASDPDEDGLSISVELFRGYSLLAQDLPDPGGTSRRRGVLLDVSATNTRIPFRLTSNPATILEQTTLVTAGSLQTVPDRTGHVASGYRFAGWDLNGVRQSDPSGAALNQFSFIIQQASTATATYVLPTADSDGDGITDWHETYYYGTIQNNSTSDTDGDGFTYAAEVFRGQSPRVTDTPTAGGSSRRRAPLLPVNAILLNLPPAIGVAFFTQVSGNEYLISCGANPFGSATSAYFEYGEDMAFDLQTPVRQLGNGLQAQGIHEILAGLQSGTTYQFRLVATNGNGTSIGQTTTFTTPNGGGYQDWADLHEVGGPDEDEEQDGWVNLLEYALGTDPRAGGHDRPSITSNAVGQARLNLSKGEAAGLDPRLHYSVQASTNLLSWSTAGVTVVEDSTTAIIADYTLPADRVFLRLSVTMDP